jgi:hydroxyethylthiazole kinase-like uncharacterized protein yjeF
MQAAFHVDEVRAAEDALIAMLPEGALMQRAATGLAGAVADVLRTEFGRVYGSRVCLLVGSGNNGGDALVAGALLARRGASVEAYCTTDHPHEAGMAAFVRAGGRIVSEPVWTADVIIDGLVGIGAVGSLREPLAAIACETADAPGFVIAVDLPSGVNPNTGEVSGAAVAADLTVTFGCLKPGLLVMPALEYVGTLVLVDIGLEPHLVNPAAFVLDRVDIAQHLPEPSLTAHKYARGVAGIAAGSPRYPGAAVLCVGAAKAPGVGMVEILDRYDGVADVVRERFPDTIATDGIEDPRITAWGVGCGFTGEPDDDATIGAALTSQHPVILDAGALTALARSAALRTLVYERAQRNLLTVLTPHDGEFHRLFASTDAAGRIAQTQALARDLRCIVVRKGAGTIIADGVNPPFIDVFGTPSLATAGSGDVLTGLCAGMCATAHHPDAAVIAAAVALHGEAGQRAAGSALELLAGLPGTIASVKDLP